MRAQILSTSLFVLALAVSTPGASAVSPSDPPDVPVHHGKATPPPEGSFALHGAAAERFRLPADVVLTDTSTSIDGRTSMRYQQRSGNASVLGGQITVVTRDGQQIAVVGAHYSGIVPTNEVRLSKAEARAHAVRRAGADASTPALRIDPKTRSFYYEVEARRAGKVLWIDAQSGSLRKSLDLRHFGDGVGVKGDHKVFPTTRSGATHLLRSPDGRQVTYDQRNAPGPRVLMVDRDDRWNLRADWTSPDQRAGVDAHYYAGVVDRFYAETFNRNSFDDNGAPLASNVHVESDFCNAYWDGDTVHFGDGFGAPQANRAGYTCRPLSGALDVVAHEFSHGVTQYTSRLFWGPESPPLGEAFSDILGTSIEFFAAARGLDLKATPDWTFGEDVVAGKSRSPGFRSLAEPRLNGDWDHYDQLAGGWDDVHQAGAIAGHAFYLASVGGRNSGCSPSKQQPATHTADCEVTVTGIGVNAATRVFYDGFTSLHETANYCDARNATVALAGSAIANVSLAWQAVGVHADCVPAPPQPPPPPPPTPCTGDANATLPFESEHPYAPNDDCLWTFDNGSPGFAFHFSLLDVEFDYDFIVIYDGDGVALAGYSGNFGSEAPPTCIPTSVGSVRLISDEFVEAEGFIVDGVVPCEPSG